MELTVQIIGLHFTISMHYNKVFIFNKLQTGLWDLYVEY